MNATPYPPRRSATTRSLTSTATRTGASADDFAWSTGNTEPDASRMPTPAVAALDRARSITPGAPTATTVSDTRVKPSPTAGATTASPATGHVTLCFVRVGIEGCEAAPRRTRPTSSGATSPPIVEFVSGAAADAAGPCEGTMATTSAPTTAVTTKFRRDRRTNQDESTRDDCDVDIQTPATRALSGEGDQRGLWRRHDAQEPHFAYSLLANWGKQFFRTTSIAGRAAGRKGPGRHLVGDGQNKVSESRLRRGLDRTAAATPKGCRSDRWDVIGQLEAEHLGVEVGFGFVGRDQGLRRAEPCPRLRARGWSQPGQVGELLSTGSLGAKAAGVVCCRVGLDEGSRRRSAPLRPGPAMGPRAPGASRPARTPPHPAYRRSVTLPFAWIRQKQAPPRVRRRRIDNKCLPTTRPCPWRVSCELAKQKTRTPCASITVRSGGVRHILTFCVRTPHP